MKTNAISAKQRLMKLLCFNYQLRHAASHKIVEARRIVTHSWNPPEQLHFDERMDCRISTHLLTLLILLHWLPQVEGSHFRHASIMWAPTDSNSNTVRTNHLAYAQYRCSRRSFLPCMLWLFKCLSRTYLSFRLLSYRPFTNCPRTSGS